MLDWIMTYRSSEFTSQSAGIRINISRNEWMDKGYAYEIWVWIWKPIVPKRTNQEAGWLGTPKLPNAPDWGWYVKILLYGQSLALVFSSQDRTGQAVVSGEGECFWPRLDQTSEAAGLVPSAGWRDTLRRVAGKRQRRRERMIWWGMERWEMNGKNEWFPTPPERSPGEEDRQYCHTQVLGSIQESKPSTALQVRCETPFISSQ